MSVKVLLDTDIGSDIDDAVCLAYLLAKPECELVGVTTVSGEARKRAMMVSALCKIAGRDIPIYPGVEQPLFVEPRQPLAQQAKVLDKWAHDTTFPEGEAIEFMRKTIRANPGEVVLLAIGPMTNVGLLFSIDPEIPRLLKSLVLMCGVFTINTYWGSPQGEWNAINDPHACDLVYRAHVGQHCSIGLDVTTRVTMDAAAFREKCSAPLLRPVLDFASVWFEHSGTVTFHDPLAAATIFDDSICTFTRGNVQVELANTEFAGKTHWRTDGSVTPQHEVALDVDAGRFFKEYFSVFA